MANIPFHDQWVKSENSRQDHGLRSESYEAYLEGRLETMISRFAELERAAVEVVNPAIQEPFYKPDWPLLTAHDVSALRAQKITALMQVLGEYGWLFSWTDAGKHDYRNEAERLIVRSGSLCFLVEDQSK